MENKDNKQQEQIKDMSRFNCERGEEQNEENNYSIRNNNTYQETNNYNI